MKFVELTGKSGKTLAFNIDRIEFFSPTTYETLKKQSLYDPISGRQVCNDQIINHEGTYILLVSGEGYIVAEDYDTVKKMLKGAEV